LRAKARCPILAPGCAEGRARGNVIRTDFAAAEAAAATHHAAVRFFMATAFAAANVGATYSPGVPFGHSPGLGLPSAPSRASMVLRHGGGTIFDFADQGGLAS